MFKLIIYNASINSKNCQWEYLWTNYFLLNEDIFKSDTDFILDYIINSPQGWCIYIAKKKMLVVSLKSSKKF